MILPYELLRVRRSKGKIIPLYAGDDKIGLAKTLSSIFEDSVCKKYGDLSEALDRCEDLGYNYRLIRGLSATLMERCSFHTRAVINPIEARRAVFEEVGNMVITSISERDKILARASTRMGLKPKDLEASLYADLSDEQILSEFRSPEPLELLKEYNFSAALAIISRAKGIELSCRGKLEEPSKLLGKSLIHSERGALTLRLELRSIKRGSQRQAELERLIASLMLQNDWAITADLPSDGKSYRFELSKGKNGSLVMPKNLRKILARDGSKTALSEKPLGDIVLVEELAASIGVTESEAREILNMNGTYIDIGGVFISTSKKREIETILGKAGEITLSDVIPKLHKLGCKRPIQVLEALGYSVNWTENREESKVHKLSRIKSFSF